MGKVGRKKRRTPVQLIRSVMRMPPADFYTRPVLHMDCGGRLEVEGCRAVLLYNENQIRLDMVRWQVTLYGDGLILEGLNGRELQIRGQIIRAEFTYL